MAKSGSSSARAKVTSEDVVEALRSRYSDERRYVTLEEVYESTGARGRRLDLVVVDCWRSGGFRIEGIEIKVSKADLRRELQNSDKHNVFMQWLDYYSLAAPVTAIDLDVIPKHWGVYAIMQDGSIKVRRKPLDLHDQQRPDIDRGFFACLMRQAMARTPSARQLSNVREVAYKQGYQAALASVEHVNVVTLREDNLKLRNALQALGCDDYLTPYVVERNKALLNCDTMRLKRDLEAASTDISRVIKYLNLVNDALAAEPGAPTDEGAA